MKAKKTKTASPMRRAGARRCVECDTIIPAKTARPQARDRAARERGFCGADCEERSETT